MTLTERLQTMIGCNVDVRTADTSNIGRITVVDDDHLIMENAKRRLEGPQAVTIIPIACIAEITCGEMVDKGIEEVQAAASQDKPQPAFTTEAEALAFLQALTGTDPS